MFWDNANKHQGEAAKSLRRAVSIVKLIPAIDPSTWDHTEEDRYGLGTVRSVDLFYKLFLIDTSAQKAIQLCPFVNKGSMHRNFMKYLRKDGLGIDYSSLQSFDTEAEVFVELAGKRVETEKKLRKAMNDKNLADIQFYSTEAKRVYLYKEKPPLEQQVSDMIASL
jgi:hypothetical protein